MVFSRNSARQNVLANLSAITQLQTDLVLQNSTISSVQSKATTNAQGIGELVAELKETDETVASQADSITLLGTRVNTHDSDITLIKSDIVSNEEAIAGLSTSLDEKEDSIDSATILTLDTVNAANDLIASRKVQAPLFNIVDDLGVSQGTISYDGTKSTVDASEYHYLNSSNVKRNLGADIEEIQNKLNGIAEIVVDDNTYDLPDLLDQVRVNKSKFDTFKDQLNDAVGDDDSGVINLMEQVSQNKADISVVVSNLAAEVTNRGAENSTLSSSLTATINAVSSTVAANATSNAAARAIIVSSVTTLKDEVDVLETSITQEHESQQTILTGLEDDKQDNISVGPGLTFVDNKVELDFNDTPTEGDSKPVSSGGLYDYKDTVDSSFTAINTDVTNVDGRITAVIAINAANIVGIENSITEVKSLAYQEIVLEGEVVSGDILFSHGMLPIETGFGIGVPKKGLLEGVHILTDQSSDDAYDGNTDLNLYIDIYDANDNITTQSIVSNGRRTNITYSNVSLPSSSSAGGNMIVVRGSTSDGSTWLEHSRIRLTLLLRSLE